MALPSINLGVWCIEMEKNGKANKNTDDNGRR